MKNDDFMKRLKAMAEIAAKISKEQEVQKDREAAEAEDDDMVLAADLLMEWKDGRAMFSLDFPKTSGGRQRGARSR